MVVTMPGTAQDKSSHNVACTLAKCEVAGGDSISGKETPDVYIGTKAVAA
jgi:hypothetical protein